MYEIFMDDQVEGEWFKGILNSLAEAELRTILGRGKNSKIIESLIAFDRPDIILLKNGNPILVLEKTREVPTGHNVGQRMARLVRAAECGVPSIMFFPFDAKKHGKYGAMCNLNIRILKCFEKITEITGSKIFAINWRCDSDGELLKGNDIDSDVSKIVNELMLEEKEGINKIYEEYLVKSRSEYDQRLSKMKKYDCPPPSVYFVDDIRKWMSEKGFDFLLKDRGKSFRSLIYKIEMEPSALKRQDPYTGMQFLYSYLYCLDKGSERKLCLYFPKIEAKIWKKTNGLNLGTKMCNWYLRADYLVFKDGYLENNRNIVNKDINKFIYEADAKNTIGGTKKEKKTKVNKEVEVYLAVKKYLNKNDFIVLAGQPPNGCDDVPVLEIKDPVLKEKGSKGAFKPDLIAYKEGQIIIIECKAKFDIRDQEKLMKVKKCIKRKEMIFNEIVGRSIFKRNGISEIEFKKLEFRFAVAHFGIDSSERSKEIESLTVDNKDNVCHQL